MKALVREDIGRAGIDALQRAGVSVTTGFDWDGPELQRRIPEFDAMLVRSATQVTAELLARATRLKVIGRAGVGVDNIDVDAATRHGIAVVNAPESNVVTAAEHTMAMVLALARNVPQAHASLTAGRWDRARFTGVELEAKMLGILGLGRIGTLVCERAQAFGMRVIAFDPFVSADRFRSLGVEHAASPDDLYAVADFVTIHLPKTRETEGWLDAEAFSKMRDGVRIINVARGALLVDEDLEAALDSGKVAGAALDVFANEPVTEHPLFGREDVVVTPHLGASTREATDRAGAQAAEQVVAALGGGAVTSAVNLPALRRQDLETMGPWLPLCRHLGQLAAALTRGDSVERVEVQALGTLGERDPRVLGTEALVGMLTDRADELVNAVNAPVLADRRGIELVTAASSHARDFADLVRVTVGDARVVGTLLGRRMRPHLLEAWGQRFNLQMEEHVTAVRYADVPGMMGTIGSLFGEAGINVISAAVGHGDESDSKAVMVLTSERQVPGDLVSALAARPEVVAVRTISFQPVSTMRPGSFP